MDSQFRRAASGCRLEDSADSEVEFMEAGDPHVSSCRLESDTSMKPLAAETPVRSATRRVRVTHVHGLHARPCLAVFFTARRFNCDVWIGYGDREAHASSMFDLIALGVPQDAEVVLSASGPDAPLALDSLEWLIADNFGFRH